MAEPNSTGCSWEQIGSTLGISRQAAQQRFGRVDDADGLATRQAWLGPVSAADEMRLLAEAGAAGWTIVSAHPLRFRMTATTTAWEHRRVRMGSARRSRLLQEGWQETARWFPWSYLSRDTGAPVPRPTRQPTP